MYPLNSKARFATEVLPKFVYVTRKVLMFYLAEMQIV